MEFYLSILLSVQFKKTEDSEEISDILDLGSMDLVVSEIDYRSGSACVSHSGHSS